MSFPPGTEIFQFPGFASTDYVFICRYTLLCGFPHSEIPESKDVSTSSGLIAAYHVLHRLSTPRHPPDALHSLPPLHNRPISPTREKTDGHATGQENKKTTTLCFFEFITANSLEQRISSKNSTNITHMQDPNSTISQENKSLVIIPSRSHAHYARSDQTCLFTMSINTKRPKIVLIPSGATASLLERGFAFLRDRIAAQ